MFEVFFFFFPFSFSFFFFFFFYTGRTFRLNVYYTKGGGGGNIQVFCSRNYSEVIPLRGITGSLVECRPRIDREKDERREGTEVDILAEVFTHSCGCSSSTLIIREWRGWLEGWPRIGILLCRVFRNSTFELFQFQFSLRCAGIFKIRFDDKHNILLFVDCRVSFFFLFFSFLRLFFFHCYYFIYATLCFNVIKKTNRATNRANCVIIWFSWFLFALRVKIFTLCSAITTVCIYRSIEDKACSWNILWRLVN